MSKIKDHYFNAIEYLQHNEPVVESEIQQYKKKPEVSFVQQYLKEKYTHAHQTTTNPSKMLRQKGTIDFSGDQ